MPLAAMHVGKIVDSRQRLCHLLLEYAAAGHVAVGHWPWIWCL